MNKKGLLLIPILPAMLTGVSGLACEPGGFLQIQNMQNQEVTIFFASVRTDGTIDGLTKQVVISANTTKIISITFLGGEWVNRIEAHDPTGKVVFSHDYKMADLEKIDWKIVLPP